MLAAAFAVHELRVLLGYGADAGHVLAAPGHEYLPFAAAVAVVLIGVAAGSSLLRAMRGGHAAARPRSFLVSWAGTAASLVAIYALQSSLEMVVDPSHPVWGHGGWLAVPIAMVVGAVVVLLLRGADRALARVARRSAPLEPVRERPQALRAPASAAWPRVAALASHLSGRAPPLRA
jgi:hypothetical protein